MIPTHPRIPVTVTEQIDSLTPWSAFLALDEGGPAILLESARVDARIGRYSIVAMRPKALWHARGDVCTYETNGTRRTYRANPSDDLRQLMTARHMARVPGLPFASGAVGFVSYEARHAFEELPQRATDDLGLPHWWFIFVDECLVFDHIAGTVTGVVVVDRPSDKPRATDRAASFIRQARSSPKRLLGPAYSDSVLQSTFSRPAFEEAVRRVLEYIAAGDVYQVNISQRLETEFRGDPRTLYAVLRTINPSPFAAFLRADGFSFVGCSPERLVLYDGARAETRPIAGTRPRGADTSEDDRLRTELLLNPKERAEHVMLVDLERNDLGRVCRYGTVHVDELMVLERYSHVNHIVSNVVGELLPDKDAIDLLAAMFPGGTITGCPKIRCMEIIDELEPVARHAYTGAIGYMNDDGRMDTNIVIRTLMIANGRAYIPVGAGIVADSEPEHEYDETMQKAKAMLRALEQAAANAS